MSEVQARLSQVMNRLGYSSLSNHQQKAVVEFVGGHDVLAVLPTGSGKSVCFASLPWLYDSYEVLVMLPLLWWWHLSIP